jgi:CubicO group peptidase (beta-lactamase class C family)
MTGGENCYQEARSTGTAKKETLIHHATGDTPVSRRMHRLTNLPLVLIIAVISQAGQTKAQGVVPPTDFAATAERYMQARVRVSGFSGAVLVAKAGRPLFRAAYGYADRAFAVPNTPETRFRLGSVTKPFTAAAILLLEGRGQLRVDDSVSRYVPNWPPAWAAVTLRHLLTHTAGLPQLSIALPLLDVSGLSRSVLPALPTSVLDLATAAERAQPLDFAPGTRFDYSNVGYVLLGEIIERVSGKSYGRFMQDEVFRPLGMTDTGAEDPKAVEPYLAHGYVPGEPELEEAGYVDLRLVGGAGALYSTVDDLMRWDQALTSDELLSASVRDRMFTPERSDYAFGWWVQRQFDRRVQWHRGNVQGFVSIIVRYPDDSLFVTVESNVERTQVLAIANELAAIAFGQPYELPRVRQVAPLDLQRFDQFVGRYTNVANPEDAFVFGRQGNQLSIGSATPGEWSFDVFAESPTRIFARALEWDAVFVVDNRGAVTEVRIRNQGLESHFRPAR